MDNIALEKGLEAIKQFTMSADNIPEGHLAILDGVTVEFHRCDHIFTGLSLLDKVFNKDKKYPTTRYYREE